MPQPIGFLRVVPRSVRASALVLALILVLTGGYNMSGASRSSAALAAAAHVPMGGTLVIDNESGGLWQSNFNPFSPAVNWYSIGALYETLMYINTLNGKATPMLATGYQWSNGNKTLTFTTRQGVQWSDGQAFSAADVAFTFNLMKKFSGLDFQSIWSVLKSVQAQGANKVVMTFQQPAVPFFYFIAGKQPIVAQHIWSSIKNPVTYADAQPVVTGPFTVQQVSPQTITFVRNPHYWQPGKPYLDKVLYPAFTSNPPANLYLAEGKAQWGGQFIPNIQAYYVSRDPANNHYWFPPNENVNLYINTTAYPLSVTAVRQALAYAIDRQRVSTIGEYGYEPPANQTGVVLPTFASWYDKSLADKYNYTFNPQKAISILKAAGFTRSGSGPFMTPKGKPLSFSVINVGGNTDWVASLEVVRSDLQQVGIGLTVENLSQNDYQSRIYNGQFDLAYDTDTVGPNPYYTYQNVLFSGNSAPIGKAASSNYERWMSPQTDALLKQFAGTTDSARQHAIVNQLQQIMLQDVPVIPVTEGVSWYQWSTKQFAGWPTQQNPYANPAPYNTPDWEQVLLNVHLK